MAMARDSGCSPRRCAFGSRTRLIRCWPPTRRSWSRFLTRAEPLASAHDQVLDERLLAPEPVLLQTEHGWARTMDGGGKKSWLFMLASGLVITASVCYFMNQDLFDSDPISAVSVSQFLSQNWKQGEKLSMYGQVSQEDMAQDRKSKRTIFRLKSIPELEKNASNQSVLVVFDGDLPPGFRAGANVYLWGATVQDGKIRVSRLTTNCGKYEPVDP